MDLNLLQRKILNEEARLNGHDNWESMKLCINESEAKFIEKIVLKTLQEVWEIKMNPQGQQTLN